MKILTPQQLRDVETKTIESQDIDLINLMERAATSVLHWLKARLDLTQNHFTIICGIGNNGGDGLALARLLTEEKSNVKVYLQDNNSYSLDNLTNQKRLKVAKIPVERFTDETRFEFPPYTIIVDCIFGYGLTRPIGNEWKSVISQINEVQNTVISVDVPSGLFCNQLNEENDLVVKSEITLTFQTPKLGLLLSENQEYVKDFEILDISLDLESIQNQESKYFYLSNEFIPYFHKARNKFSYKGNYGHALVVGGSHGKIGANVLTTKAVLKSGAGLVTSYVPKCGYEILQTVFPEAMVLTDFSQDKIIQFPTIEKFNAIAIGPGMGMDGKTLQAFEQFLNETDLKEKALVLDADVINLLAQNQNLISKLPENTILTPHIGELKRLIGEWEDDYDRIEKTKEFAQKYKLIIISKDAHTAVFSSDGEVYFNSTGNPGMATAGSGDVLTGIITGQLAKGFEALNAAVFGVYLHGLAGDLAKEQLGEESLMASDIINYIPVAYKQLFG
ncbi:NAD(P)H-hydrate dehydratase [Moheibacter sediminis]|uniref:Bifunctional NAD(P)H-hydrate repair enzyme n=1 Tax=Moheibacter sediminis TaxID=1434700 RepID=A0A1W1ZA11_9FLAO|nr:NAD(P)H-hydrate dehydratase [Moheibacter sediminis]SMC45192.1 yjeF C-terminal region, hydroxyethylthiazole kinase-related/yjeF N-terminal region [Moheibacter sediminis]